MRASPLQLRDFRRGNSLIARRTEQLRFKIITIDTSFCRNSQSKEIRRISTTIPHSSFLGCVSKSQEMQFRVDLPSFQGDFPQACWRQVKGNKRRNAGKDAENALQGF